MATMTMKIITANTAFNLPFHFYSFPDFESDASEKNFFDALERHSQKSGINVTLSSLYKYNYSKRVLVAYNPVLPLAGTYEEVAKNFSANHHLSFIHNVLASMASPTRKHNSDTLSK